VDRPRKFTLAVPTKGQQWTLNSGFCSSAHVIVALAMSVESKRAPRLPPRWFIRTAWAAHRALYAVTGGRLGLTSATPDSFGTLRLRTIGRRTGEERKVIVGYLNDGPNLVLVAMNGWAEPTPSWWLNLQTHPDTTVDLREGSRQVTARIASEDERSRLWAKSVGPWTAAFGDLDSYAALRSRKTPVVILEPRPR
jgi:deazaflavin-dependent oxidoreductase (nitroreductase family)